MRQMHAALTVLLLLAASSAQALVCPRTTPEIRVIDVSEPVAIDRTKGIAELTFLRRPGRGLHSNGLYTFTTHVRMLAEFDAPSDGRQACLTVSRIRAEFGLQRRTIHIARDYPDGSCEAKAVLEHERRHVAVDERLITQELPAFRAAFDRAARFAVAGPIPPSERERTEARLKEELETEFRRAVEAFESRRDAAQIAIDSPAEYDRVQRLCPGGWQ